MNTPLCITILLCFHGAVLTPRKALWCVSFINSVLSINVAEISAKLSAAHVLVRSLLPNGGVALGVW